LEEVKRVRSNELRALRQQLGKPPLVLLTPVPKIWRETLTPKGQEAFVSALMKSLAAEGVIEFHDFTRFFDFADDSVGGQGECAAFFDLYHQNTVGQARLTDALLAIFESSLYAPARAAVTVPAR
jgi:hypothetical protein